MNRTIVRSAPKRDYTVIPNALLRDPRLSLDMKGLLIHLLGKPENWVVHLSHLAKEVGVAKDKMQSLMRKLIAAGYVARRPVRDAKTKKFAGEEYVVFDSPQPVTEEAANANEPQPEKPATGSAEETVNTRRKTAARPKVATVANEPEPEKPEPAKPPLLNTDLRNPSSKGLAPPEGALEEKGTGQHPPPSQPATLNAQVWKAARAILQPKELGCVSGWLQRVKDRPKGLETLLGIIETARRQGTGQPVPYIVAALNREFPPPPDPRKQPRAWWEMAALAVAKTNHWPQDWGPRPGESGCLMPADLVSPEIIRAASIRRVA